MAIKVGINGFGRIGRNLYRAVLNDKDIEIVAVNDITSPDMLAYLLKHDSVLGGLKADIKHSADGISVDGHTVRVFKERDPGKIDWPSLGVEVVVESTGLFTNAEDARKHMRGPVKKVIISAPAKNEDITICIGVNDNVYDPAKHHVISNASCTTNCLSPVAKVIHETFGIESGLMTTIHSYTNDQRLLDLPHSDMRRARAAALSMIPTSTGAAKSNRAGAAGVEGQAGWNRDPRSHPGRFAGRSDGANDEAGHSADRQPSFEGCCQRSHEGDSPVYGGRVGLDRFPPQPAFLHSRRPADKSARRQAH
jgi:glyceraldehyde 3-phosphate dehydrogenase